MWQSERLKILLSMVFFLQPLSECDCSIKMAFLGTFYRHFLNLSGSMTTKEMAPGIDMTCSRPFIFYSIPAWLPNEQV